MQSFLDKGRMEALLQDMPVKVILNDDCGLIGCGPLHAGAESVRDSQIRITK